jgi:hypothetical protein
VAACSNAPAPGTAAGTITCTTIGCSSSFTIDYPSAVDGSYTVTLSAGPWTETFPCPATDGRLILDAGGYWPYTCDATGFVFFWNGAEPADGGPETITDDVAIAGSDGGITVPQTAVVGTLGSTFYPNGPVCGPVCQTFEGTL